MTPKPDVRQSSRVKPPKSRYLPLCHPPVSVSLRDGLEVLRPRPLADVLGLGLNLVLISTTPHTPRLTLLVLPSRPSVGLEVLCGSESHKGRDTKKEGSFP